MVKEKILNPKKNKTETAVLPSENKFKKYTVYFGIIKNELKAQSVEKWVGLYYYYPTDNIYYTAQRLERFDYKFTGLNAVNLGINNNIALNKSLSFSYGVGIDLFAFLFKDTKEVLDIRVITEYETISESMYFPGEVIETQINTEIGDEQDNYLSSNYRENIEHYIAAITIPITLKYEVFKNFSASVNAAISSPVSSRVIGEKYDFSIGSYVKTGNGHDTNINRIFLNTGIGVQYDFYSCSIGINYKHYLNSVFTSITRESDDYNYRYLGKVTMNSLEVRLGYNF